MKKITCMLLLLAALSANAQVKQRSTTKGFSAALQVHSLGWTSEYFKFLDEGAPNGFGGGIRLGYGINEMFEPYFAYDFTTINLKDIDAESYKMNHMDLGVRLNFVGNVHPVRPFVEAGYTYLKGTIKRVVAGSTYVDAEYYGGKPHLGGGVSFFPSIPISLFAKGIFTVGKKSNLKLDGMVDTDKPDVTTFRITAGIGINIQELLNK